MNYGAHFLLALMLAFCQVADVHASEVGYLSKADILHSAALPGSGLLVSGQPDTDVLDKLADEGYVAVIDMRTPGEDRGMDELRETQARGFKYFSIPIDGSDGVNFENAAELDEILSLIDGPVFLHCRSGNRVGALLALRENLNGASPEDSLAFGKQAGLTSLADAVESRLAESTDKAEKN
jgi:uncharacterized protein (TIGR01244 family)